MLAGRLPGIGLDEAGEGQAVALRARLGGLVFHKVISSPLERCLMTARHAGLQPEVDDRLIECDYGHWAGRSLAELSEEPLWADIRNQPDQVTFPGGESMVMMRQRAVAAVRAAVADLPEATVIGILSHADILKAIVSWALAQPFNEFQRIVLDPASVSVIEVGRQVTRVLALNTLSGAVNLPELSEAPR